MHYSAPLRALLATACALPILASAGCKEEGPGTLFDEEGTWVLSFFKIEDGDFIGGFGSPLREGKYMIFFDKTAKIVAAAACNDSMGSQGVTESQCDLPKEAGGYYCRCFNYEFEDDQMTWTEFVPEGQPAPPTPDEDQQMMGATPPDAGVRLTVEEYSPDEFNDTYRFTSLPFGVFDSNGVTSEHVFQGRAESVFDSTGCRDVCGIAAAAEM